MKLLPLGLILLCLAVGTSSPAADQEPTEAAKPPAGMNMYTPADQKAQDQRLLNTARQLIQTGNYEGAAGLLESVYQRDPDNQVIMNLLRTCYEQTGQYAKGELLIRRMLAGNPDSHLLHVFLAESLFRQGDTTRSLAEYDAALSLVRDRNIGLYAQIVRSMMNVGLSDRALALIQRLRTELATPALFAREAGEIRESRGDYIRAVEEYYVAMADTGHSGLEAENKLFLLLEFEKSAADVVKILKAHTADSTAARAGNILAAYYLKAGDMDQAMHYTLLCDSLNGTNGTALLSFMRTCNERGLHRQAVVVGSEIIARYGNSPILSEARFMLADALTHQGRLPEAIAAYDTIIAVFPRPQDKSEAAYCIGMIYLDLMDDPRRALNIFDSIASTYPGGIGYLRSMLATPDAYVRLDRLDSARTALRALGKRQVNEDVAEELVFKLAQLDFFDHRFDSAAAAFRRLMVEYPRGFYVNDALQLMLVIDEAGQTNPILGEYADALLFAKQRRYDSSMARLEQIAVSENSPLADVALYQLSQTALALFDSTASLGYIDRLTEKHSASYYLPFALKAKGDIYIADPSRLEAGKEIYRQLLLNHPNYPFISEIRKRLRDLEEDARTG